MAEINKEVDISDYYQTNPSNVSIEDLGKLHIDQTYKRKHSNLEDDNDSSNVRSPESQGDRDSGISSVEACTPESVFTSSDEFQCMSTPSPLKQDESPYHENSGIDNGPSVESSNPESRLTSSDESQSSTASTMELDERSYHESPGTACSKQSDSSNGYLGRTLNKEECNCCQDNRRRELDNPCVQKNWLQGNWKYLKNNIEPSMFPDFVKYGLAAMEDDPKYVRSEKRSKKMDMVLMRVIQKVENDNDLKKFKHVVGPAVWGKLGIRQLNPYETEVSEYNTNFLRLSSNYDAMVKQLRSEDIEMIKDWFVEEFIISMKENDQITNRPGFCEAENGEFTEYFVKEFIIKKSSSGTYQCLLECLEEKVRKKFTRLRPLLNSLKKDDVTETDAGIKASVIVLQVVKPNYTEQKQEKKVDLTTKDCKLRLEFLEENEHTEKVYDEIMAKAKMKNGQIRKDIGGYIGNITPGSVVIHMVALDEDMLQNIIDKIRTGQFWNVVKLLLNDAQIKRYLPVGKSELEVTCFEAHTHDVLNHKTCGLSHQLNPIADNKSFIEEEMDTLYVLTELEKHDVHIGIGVHFGDRELRARHIMKKALSDEKISKMLHQVLLEGETTSIKDRLRRYKKVYDSDPSQLEKNIFRHFTEIITKVFVDDIRLVLTERNIIKDEIFDKANEKSQEKNEAAMAHILTEIVHHGTDAMLTLVDALYVVQFNKLADKLMTRDGQVDDQVQKEINRECVQNSKQAKINTSDEIPLASGKYEIIVRTRSPPTKKLSAIPCTRKRKFTPFDNETEQEFYNNGVRCSAEYRYQDDVKPFSVFARCYQFQHSNDYGMKYPVEKRFAAFQTLGTQRYIDYKSFSTFGDSSIIDIVQIYWNNKANRYIDDNLSSPFWNASICDMVRKNWNNEANGYIDDRLTSTFWNACFSDMVKKNQNSETKRYIDDKLSSSFWNISIIDIVRIYLGNEANRSCDDKPSSAFLDTSVSDIVKKIWNNDAKTYISDKLSSSMCNVSIGELVRIYLNNDEKEMDVERLCDIDDIIKKDLSGSPSGTS